MEKRTKSIQDQIYDLLNPAPSELQSDDEFDTQTKAKVVETYDENFEDNDEQPDPRRLKSTTSSFDDDPRYTGKRVSRIRVGLKHTGSRNGDIRLKSGPLKVKDLETDEEASDEDLDEESGEENNSDGSDEREYDKDFEGEEEDDDDYEQEEEDSNDYEEDEDGDDSEGTDINDGEFDESKSLEDGVSEQEFQHISKKDIQSEIEKGKAVKNQISVWDNLLEYRIHMQKILVAANRLPQYNTIDTFKNSGDSEFSLLLKKSQNSVQTLLDKLIDMQDVLVSSFSETKNLENGETTTKNESDEEIPSDSEVESSSESPELLDEKKSSKPPKKRRRLDNYEDLLSSHHKKYADYCYSTIQKWNDKTRLISGKMSNRNFSAFETSTRKQIEQILSNRSRLIKRTQLKRSVTSILGENVSENMEIVDQQDYNTEIFDDSDFYHQLLRELIERRAGDSTDPSVLGKRWAMLQRLRVKMKRRIDTRATKGRRIRFDPHQKLVGFMAPVADNSWTEQARNELFSSLFGVKSV